MDDLPENLFANPVWNALQTKHRHFAVCAGDACRYPSDVAPFAAVSEPSQKALQQLHSLLRPGESVWSVGDHSAQSYAQSPELSFVETLDCLQMMLPETITPIDPPPEQTFEIIQLSKANAPEMVALTDIAFPGFFRQRTCEMGSYYGVRPDARSGGELIAMAGERLVLDGYPEISGVCTQPAHRGKGLASSLIWQLVRDHRRHGLVSWLHVGSENLRAIELYSRMGFKKVREVTLNRISPRGEDGN
jgi:ribosomal protein S18 acetylase RimI-like enzyme